MIRHVKRRLTVFFRLKSTNISRGLRDYNLGFMGLPFGLQGVSCLRQKSLSRTEPSKDDDSPHPYHFVFSDRRATNPRINRFNPTQSILLFRSINTYIMISFHLPLFLLLYMLIFLLRTKQNPRTTQISSHGDETKWEVSCLFRL